MRSGGELYDMAVAAGFVDCLVTAYDKKSPISKWKVYQDRHLTDEERAAQRALAEETVNPGFWSPTGGPHGFVAFDPDDDEALDVLRDLCGDDTLRSTARERTPRGGRHVLFGVPSDDRTPNNGASGVGGVAGLHFRGYGGGIKHWPSAGYVLEQALADGLEPLPDGLRRLLGADGKYSSGQPLGDYDAEPSAIPEGQRNQTLFRRACALRRADHARADIQAAISEMNKRCRPPLSAVEVRHIVGNAMKYEPNQAEEMRRSFHCTDAGNAELFCDLYDQELRYDHRRGSWFVWEDHHWGEDADGRVYRLAVQATRQRHQAALQIDDLRTRGEEARFALQSENRQRLEAMLSLAHNLPPLATAGDTWNQEPLVLGVGNGVVDLETGCLRAGRPSELINRFSNVRFISTATCTRWHQFLSEIFLGDEALIDWIWRLTGYLLTELTNEQCFFLCYGVGSNGKSLYLKVLRALLGLYSFNAPFATFESQARSQIPNDLAAMVDRRLVTSSETNPDTRLNEARLKMLTGGDPVTARFLNREFFTYVPVAKFVLAVNHLPRVRDYSHGFWRRMRLIPFAARFEGKTDDRHLDKKLLRELPGILNWAIRGCREWQERGLDPPEAVRLATSGYRSDSNPLAEFLTQRCRTEKGSATRAAVVHEAYRKWADEQGLGDADRLGRNRFFELLSDHFAKRHTNAGNLYDGLRLHDPAAPALDEQ